MQPLPALGSESYVQSCYYFSYQQDVINLNSREMSSVMTIIIMQDVTMMVETAVDLTLKRTIVQNANAFQVAYYILLKSMSQKN